MFLFKKLLATLSSPAPTAVLRSRQTVYQWLGRGAGIIRVSIDRHLHFLSP
jgi:hypothetical protein